MKFVLLCDVVAAPDTGNPVFGMRLSGAGLRRSYDTETDEDLALAAEKLFAGVKCKAIPLPSAGLGDYLNELGKSAGPLFPWIGGDLGFTSYWAQGLPGEVPNGTVSPLTANALPLPRGSGQPNFEMTDETFAWLLYTAMQDLTASSPPHTAQFTKTAPFMLTGLTPGNDRARIDEVSGEKHCFRYEAFMAALASMAAPLPHGRLNLVRFAEMTSAPVPGNGNRALLVAAPSFTPRATDTLLQPDLSDPGKIRWDKTDAGIIATIPYQTPFNNIEIEAICRAVDLSASPSSGTSFLDRSTFWVRRTHTGDSGDYRKGVGLDDSFAQLPGRLSEVFDLPHLLVNIVEEDSRAAGAPLASALSAQDRMAGAVSLSQAVLIALRDVVGPGCIVLDPPDVDAVPKTLTGPNGSPAHLSIIEQVNAAVTVSDQLSEKDRGILADAVIALDKAFRDAFQSGGIGRDEQLGAWFDIVAGAIGPGLGMPQTGKEFLADVTAGVAGGLGSGPFDASTLRKVVDAANDPDNAASIQIALWRKALSSVDGFGSWLSAAKAGFVAASNTGFDLLKLLRAANIDLPWIRDEGIWRRASDPAMRDVDVLRGTQTSKGNIRDAVISYVHGTLCEAGNGAGGLELRYEQLHGRIGNLPASARAIIAEAVDANIKTRVLQWFEEPKNDDDGSTLLSGTLVADAHPVILQIDRLVVAQASATDLNDDMAGYGLLMRRSEPPEDWRCLTATFAEINPDNAYGATTTAIQFEDAPRTVLSPLPVGYIGPAPQAYIPYDNRPVVGDSDTGASADEQDSDARITRLVQPVVQNTPPSETLLPFLAYGATYEVAPFGISNHGGLPTDIRRDDYPALLDPSKLTVDQFVPPDDTVRRFTYLRRTGIGALRVAPAARPDGDTYNPLIPGKETKPIAEEIFVPSVAVEPWQPNPSKPPRPLKLKTALLLANPDGDALSNDAGSLTLEISAPVTPIEDFDRWMALDEALLAQADPDRAKLRAFRKELRNLYDERTEKLNDLEMRRLRQGGSIGLDREIAELREQLALQDPAVDALAISVRRVRRSGTLSPEAVDPFNPVLLPWGWHWSADISAEDPFKGRPPITLTCKIDQHASTVFDEDKRTIAVAAGDVVVVQLFAAVRHERFSGSAVKAGDRRFDSVVRKASVGDLPDDALPSDGETKYRLFSLHEFAVEAASPLMPSVANIASQIVGSVIGDRPASDERTGDIRLDFTRQVSAAMDAVGTISVGAQAWRWTGRPLSAFPFKSEQHFNDFPAVDPGDPNDPDPTKQVPPPSASEYPLLWDVAGFAERLDETLDPANAPVPISETIVTTDGKAKATPRAIRIALNSPGRVETARYLRFMATARPRYEAAYKAAGVTIKPVPVSWESPSKLWSTPWYRMLRPAAYPAEIPKPGIKALLPLTRSLYEGDSPSPVAGVLAIVDGAWFELSGLGDWMLGGVEIARRTKFRESGSTISASAVEMGPDPLVRAYGLGSQPPSKRVSPTNSKELRGVAPVSITGPLGHTFDTGTATGLYLNSSFVVRPPDFTSDDPDAWWMSKLAFRRMVLAEAIDDYWLDARVLPARSTTGQVSITQHATKAQGGKATASFVLDASLATSAKTFTRKILVDARQINGEWAFAITDPADNGFAGEFKLRAASFDLRFLAVRKTSRIVPTDEKSPLYAWFELLLMVRAAEAAWMLAWETRLFDEVPENATEDTSAAELTLNLSHTLTAATTGETKVSDALQVSEPTEGRWAQFMPNTEALVRSSSVSLSGLSMTVDPGDTTKLLLSAGGMEWGWLATDALCAERGRGSENQGLFNLLLVTSGIKTVSGGEDEAFIGLYHSPTGYDSSRKAVSLVPFSSAAGSVDLDGKPLIGRIVTVRSGRPNVLEGDIRAWRDDPWKHFFPREGAGTTDPAEVFGNEKAPDVSLHMIEIYAPIQLSQTA